MSDLEQRLAKLSPDKRALLAAKLKQKAAAGDRGIKRRPRGAGAPLSFTQERLWLLDRLEQTSAYNDRMVLQLQGQLDVPHLQGTLKSIVQRHEILRTCFPTDDGTPVQRLVSAERWPLPVVDLSGLDTEVALRRALRLAEAVGRHRFTLDAEAPLRLLLLRITNRRHWLSVTIHHIAVDGWSWGIFQRELGQLYALPAGSPGLPELPIQYADYAHWQRQHLAGETLERETGYWRRQLEGMPELLELPGDRPRPTVQTFRGDAVPVSLPETLSQSLEALGRGTGATLYMVLLAGFQWLLSRLSGQRDLAVGSPTLGRNRRELESLIGVFINFIVLRGQPRGEMSIADFLDRTRERATAAFAHQDLPFEKLVAALELRRELGYAPLIQVVFNLRVASPPSPSLAGMAIEPVSVGAETTRYDLGMELEQQDGRVRGHLQYNADLFDRTTIERWSRHWQRLLESMVAEPERRLMDLEMLSPAQRHQLLWSWNDSSRPLPVDFLPGRIVAACRRWPDREAIGAGDEILTYGELEDRSGAVARALAGIGIGEGSRVGILLERGVSLAVALVGVMRSGAAYVPLDPSYPAQRLSHVVNDGGLSLILGGEDLEDLLEEVVHEATPLRRTLASLLETPSSAVANGADQPKTPHATSLAYVIYTSGSTGLPKGVQVPHGALSNFAAAMVVRPGLSPEDRLLAVTTVSFDISVLELLVPLSVGARVEVVGRDVAGDGRVLAERLSSSRTTVMQATPATWRLLLESGWPQGEIGGNLRVWCGGEALAPGLAARLVKKAGEVWNLYGPTETAVWSSVRRIRAGEQVLLGGPIDNTMLQVLDRDGRTAPVGVYGELLISGEGVTQGYWGRPALTAERFVPDPYPGAAAGSCRYRTGDRVRYRPDGSLEFGGRLDHQIKLRGFRIEPGEIEAQLLRHPGVGEAVVALRPDAPGGENLVAYWVRSPGAEASCPTEVELSRESLRQMLGQSLPDYMVPGLYMELDHLPRTPNGKVDRRSLPVPGEDTEGRELTLPRTALESAVAEVWCELLNLEQVGVEEDFFTLGGHSLLANRMMMRLRESLGVEVPLRALFGTPTVAGIASAVEHSLGRTEGPPLRPIESDEPAPLSYSQEGVWFHYRLHPESSVYNLAAALKITGALQLWALERAMIRVLERQRALRTRFEEKEGKAVQQIPLLEAERVKLPVVDLSALSVEDRRKESECLARRAAGCPFDLQGDLLLRLVVVLWQPDRQGIFLNTHHIVGDGASLRNLARELFEFYAAEVEGRSPRLPKLSIQYTDFARWQRRWFQGDLLDRQMRYWRRQLREIPTETPLPADRPRPEVTSGFGGRISLQVAPQSVTNLRGLGRDVGATPSMVYMAGLKVLLFSSTGCEDLVVGMPVQYRNLPQLEPLVGFFANTVALRTDLSGNPDFSEVLRRLRRTTLEALAHQDLPFNQLVRELNVSRQLRHNPIFQVGFTFEDAEPAFPEIDGLRVEAMNFEIETVQFDLNLSLFQTRDSVSGSFQYNADLFEQNTAETLTQDYLSLLTWVGESPGLRLSQLKDRLEEKARDRRAEAQRSLSDLTRTRLRRSRRRVVTGVRGDE